MEKKQVARILEWVRRLILYRDSEDIERLNRAIDLLRSSLNLTPELYPLDQKITKDMLKLQF